MFKYTTSKKEKYFDEVIRLHFEENMLPRKISEIIPLNTTTIRMWIRTFAKDKKAKEAKMKRKAKEMMPGVPKKERKETAALLAEIAELKEKLRKESIRVDLYREIINVAEKQFGISISKKAGTKQ